MQNRYVGDVGDFGKLGLLRLLAGSGNEPIFRLGIVWYLFPDEGHNKDGKHVTYLNRKDDSFRICDVPLFDKLRSLFLDEAGLMVSSKRSIDALETARLLPPTTHFFNEALSYSAGLSTPLRRSQRSTWFTRALEETAFAELIFVDPDNGIECDSVSITSSKGPKYVYWEDIKAFVARGQSLVIYHHLNRNSPHPQQVEKKLQELTSLAPESYEAYAVTFNRGTNRAYFVLAAPQHKELLRERLSKIKSSPWRRHFTSF